MKIKLIVTIGILFLYCSCSPENFINLHILESPNKKFEIKIKYIEPTWGNAVHTICIESTKKANGTSKLIDSYRLKNDGTNLNKNNVSIHHFDDNGLTLIFDGEEQVSDTIQFIFTF